jgi:hypothetical protein
MALLAQGRPARKRSDEEGWDALQEMQHMTALTTSFNAAEFTGTETKANSYADRGMDIVERFLALATRTPGVGIPGGTPSSEGIEYGEGGVSHLLVSKCNASLKELRHGNTVPEDSVVATPPSPTRGRGRGDGRDSGIPRPAASSPYDYAAKLGLNDEQAVCFLSYVSHAEAMFAGVTDNNVGSVPPDAPTPAFWVLTGEGGSGKTHTIRAIVDYFEFRGWIKHLRVAATTGAAAANLCRSASTVDSLLGFSRNLKSRTSPSDASNRAFETAFQNVYYLIIDEYSMMSVTKLTDICVRLKQGQASDLPAGRISILFAGDPHQFQPVQGIGLSRFREVLTPSDVDQPDARPTPPKQQHLDGATGAMVWQGILTWLC